MQNLTMLTDLYELTMLAGYRRHGMGNRRAVFYMFYRGASELSYAVMAGNAQFKEYILGLRFSREDISYLRSLGIFEEDFLSSLEHFRFEGDIDIMPEGTIVFPGEPLVRVKAPLSQAQLIETAMLNLIGHQTLIATKGNRVSRAAKGDKVMEFGLRRAQGPDAGVLGARAAIVGGCHATSNVMAGQRFGIPVSGTHAHSWVMSFPDELTAFRAYASIFPDGCLLLVDTYDTLRSGVPNAIRVFEELKARGHKPLGIRLDSGDLAYLSREARAMLDAAGFETAKIVVSNSLDEYTITSILDQGGRIDAFGVGERMITARSEPVFGAVYKLCAVAGPDGAFQPRIKISETVAKITNPGLKQVYRVYNADGKAVADLITGPEGIDTDAVRTGYRFADPERPWKKREFKNCTAKPLQSRVMAGGRRTGPAVSVRDIAAYVRRQLAEEIWEEEQRFENPHKHYIDMSPEYYAMKMRMLEESHG